MSRAALAALVVGKEAASASAVTVHNLTYQVSLSLLFFSLSPGCVREGAPKLTPPCPRTRTRQSTLMHRAREAIMKDRLPQYLIDFFAGFFGSKDKYP